MVSNIKKFLVITLIIASLSQIYSVNKVVGVFKNLSSPMKKDISRLNINKFSKRYLVKYKGNSSNKQVETINVKYTVNQWHIIEINEFNEFQNLRNDPNVESIVPDYPRKLMSPNDSYYNSQNNVISGQFDQWNLRNVGLLPLSDPDSAWNISTGSNSTVIAVIDTGIALDNPDIANGSGTNWDINNLWINQSEIPPGVKVDMDANSDDEVDSLEMITYFINNNLDVNDDGEINFLDMVSEGSPLIDYIEQDGNGLQDDLFGFNFVDYNPDVNDLNGHGTHVSGIIGASTDNNSNVNPGVAGICWSCKIMTLKVVNSSGYAYDSDIIDAILYAVDKGAKVINISLGGPGYSQPLQDAITFAWENGVLVVSAAGNAYGSASDTYPGGNSYSMSVGSIDHLDQVSPYSNTGGKLDVVAPGDKILSTYISAFPSYGILNVNCVGQMWYGCSSGTSMAAPHVSGLAGLIFDLHKNDPAPWNAKEVRYAILQNTTELPTDQTNKPNCTIILGSFDECSGFGKINAINALSASSMPDDPVNPIALLNDIPEFIKGTLNITGTATDENIYSYTISFVRVLDNEIIKQFTGRNNIYDSLLFSVDTSVIPDGEYFIILRVEDFQGNAVETSSNTFNIDNTPPSEFTLLEPEDGSATNNLRPNFSWSASDDENGVVYDFYYDGNLLSSDISETSYTPSFDITEGSKTWYVVAKDPAGNTKESNSFTLIADRVPPNDFTVNTSISGSTPTFTFETTDNLSGMQGYQASLDGGPFESVSSPYSPGSLSDGTHIITIKAFDNAGNTKVVSTTITINYRCNFLKSRADFNCDGRVDLTDLSILAAKWGTNNYAADANNDNITNLTDLSILALNWSKNF